MTDNTIDDSIAITIRLPAPLLEMLRDEAGCQGIPVDHLLGELVVRHLGSLRQRGAGRCSLRTGLASEGPKPLPLQQP